MATSPFRNRESVIRAILRREREVFLELRSGQRRVKPALSGAFRHFGSWRNALQRPESRSPSSNGEGSGTKRESSPVCELCRRRQSLRQTAVHRYDSGLHRAACLTFGSWCNALVAAGINPESICRDPQWDQTKIIEAILLRVVRGEALGSTTVRPHTLKSAAVREFGSWPAALVAAGLEPAHYIGQRVMPRKREARQLEQGAGPQGHSPTPCTRIAALWQCRPPR